MQQTSLFIYINDSPKKLFPSENQGVSRRWLVLIKNYDLGINYRPGKTKVEADALSHKKYCNATFPSTMQPEL
jgi:hypothetical protein